MKQLSSELITLLSGYQFHVAELYTLTLTNGRVFRWTSGDGDIQAGNVLSLPNTGAGILDGDTDPNYAFTVISGTAVGVSGHACVPSSGSLYRSAENAAAKWLTPSVNSDQAYDQFADGTYRYRLTFDLSGVDVSSVDIAGVAIADNGVAVLINGVTLGSALTGASTSSVAFSVPSSNLIQGANTLDFIVTNIEYFSTINPNLTSLHVTFTSSSFPDPNSVFTAIDMERDDITWSTGLSVDECKVTLHRGNNDLINGLIFPNFARIGGFDNAHIKIELAVMSTYGDVSNGLIHLFEGRVTDIVPSTGKVELTVSADTIRLDTMIPNAVYQPSCTHTLYDGQCGVNRTPYSEVNYTVAGASVEQIWFDSPTGDGFFNLGKITFNTGLNAGLSRTVKSYAHYATAVAVVNHKFPYQPEIGDEFVIVAGCDKLRTTCANRFHNEANFLGWEYMPVPEASV
jgi:uncharacterized phage protein (TIGR02218 family)